jgi:hypothetical protein
MPKPRVYVETTIPNFYYDRRKDPAVVSRRAWTREWWSTAVTDYELLTGAPVVGELLAGISSRVSARIRAAFRFSCLTHPMPKLCGCIFVTSSCPPTPRKTRYTWLLLLITAAISL